MRSTNIPLSWSFLFLALISFNLQGCVATGSGEVNGLLVLCIGIFIAYIGYKFATKSSLEQWAMKLLKIAALMLLIG